MTTPSATTPTLLSTLTASELAGYVHGALARGVGDERVGGVSTDTRRTASGETFVALTGERFNGHDYLQVAFERGAAGVVVERGNAAEVPKGPFVVEVDDTTTALGDLASAVLEHRRAQGPFPVIAVTGSNGKTTTKEMLGALLETRHKVLVTSGNFNNWIGMPLVAFQLTAEHTAAVFELGANHPGEIHRLQEICAPDICVLTCIAPAHLEGFGSLDGVARAKSEIFAGDRAIRFVLPRETMGYYPHLEHDPRLRTVGTDARDYLVIDRVETLEQGTRATLTSEQGSAVVDIPLLGEHNASNFGLALTAVTSAPECTGLDWNALDADTLAQALTKLALPSGRLEPLRYADDIEVLHDAYNANPSSMRAGLAVLAQRAPEHSRVAVLGEMRELGAHAEELHRALGEEAARLAPRLLICVGHVLAEAIAEGARAHGLSVDAVQVMAPEHIDDAAKLLRERLCPGDVVFLKGSRAMKLERITDLLRKAEGARGD